ncbi:hypothetical protein NO107_08395 [Bacillus safensis]
MIEVKFGQGALAGTGGEISLKNLTGRSDGAKGKRGCGVGVPNFPHLDYLREKCILHRHRLIITWRVRRRFL